MKWFRRLAVVAVAGLIGQIASAAEPEAAGTQAPIPVAFSIDKPGVVTLVIEDQQGKRVRNLVSETRFEAGRHTVYWDGLDESFVKPKAGDAYVMAGKLVPPGAYRVRGLTHDGVTLRYQFTAYNAGSPPWLTPDHVGAWTADHTPPEAILYLPDLKRMMIGSHVVEGGDGVVWTDLQGKKLGGIRWVEGIWAAANLLARDDGPGKSKSVAAYVASYWMEPGKKREDNPRGELRLSSIDAEGKTKPILLHIGYVNRDAAEPVGLAARDSILLVAIKDSNELMVVDAETASGKRGDAKVLNKLPLPRVGAIAFDADGNLLALVGDQLHRYAIKDLRSLATLPPPEVLVKAGLDEPQQLTTDSKGNIYISTAGQSHQVKVFDRAGKPIRTVGKPGAPAVGAYDPDRMQNPKQIAVTDDGRLWVAERDYLPKRVSVWSAQGKLLTDFIGPPDYGGGGEIDPADPTRFYYADSHAGTMELELDWAKGTSRVKRVLYRPGADDLLIESRVDGNGFISPQTPVRVGERLYLTNQYNSTPTSFPTAIGVWLVRNDQSNLVAATGNAYFQPWLRAPEMASCWPKEIDFAKVGDPKYQNVNSVTFVWSDLNLDGKAQPDEVQCVRMKVPTRTGSVTRDLSMVFASGDRLKVDRFTSDGVPRYDISKMDRVMDAPVAGGNLLDAGGGWAIVTGGPVKGYRDGELMWTYPNQWPSLHAGHAAPQQQYPGQLIATTKIIGYDIKPKGAKTAPIWAYNGDRGNAFLLTNDGLFVSQLFRDERGVEFRWDRLAITRNTDVTGRSVPAENFWPRVVQVNDGEIYIITGKVHSSIVKVTGLESLRPIEPTELNVTPELLAKVGPYLAEREAARQAALEPSELTVRIRATPPTVDGKMDDWADAQWARVDEHVEAAMSVAGDKLYVAYRSTSGDFLDNEVQSLQTLFKSGGALDLMLGATGKDRAQDRRLLVTRDKGKTMAAYYQPKVPGTAAGDRVVFSSPWRTVYFDRVSDLSDQVTLQSASFPGQITVGKTTRNVTYVGFEYSVPLASVGLPAGAGTVISGDIGILRGSGGLTSQRIYWHNKGAGLINDVPGEATLQPGLWGTFRFDSDKPKP